MMNKNRVVFLDYLRVIACFMVMLVHCCECFYLNDEGFCLNSYATGAWVTLIDSACRASVPLFVIASAYLLFPVTHPTGEFLRRRLLRVAVPYAIFCCAYTLYFGGDWTILAFNFPIQIVGGHLWFVPMLIGLYLLMPLLSPWAEKASEKEVRGWLLAWLFTTTFPFLRKLFVTLMTGKPFAWSHTFGSGDFGSLPFLWGECGWNPYGMFHYVSGFFGYMLFGFWLRKFVPTLSWRRTLAWAVPIWVAGYLLVAGFFWLRLPFDGTWPFVGPWGVERAYPFAVEMEVSWEFTSLGVALTAIGTFLIVRKFVADGAFYRCVIRPLSEASFGTYLAHMFFLVWIMPLVQDRLPTPLAIFGCASLTFIGASLFSLIVRRIPKVGKWICG